MPQPRQEHIVLEQEAIDIVAAAIQPRMLPASKHKVVAITGLSALIDAGWRLLSPEVVEQLESLSKDKLADEATIRQRLDKIVWENR